MGYEQEQDVLERLEEQRNLRKFSQRAVDNKLDAKKIKNLINSKNQIKEVSSIFDVVDFSKDAPQVIVIIFSIFADLLTLIPLFGSALALFFSFFFFIYYFLSGHYKKRAIAKASITGLASVLEIVGLGINMLPFFTTSAVINYGLVLSERKNNQTQE